LRDWASCQPFCRYSPYAGIGQQRKCISLGKSIIKCRLSHLRVVILHAYRTSLSCLPVRRALRVVVVFPVRRARCRFVLPTPRALLSCPSVAHPRHLARLLVSSSCCPAVACLLIRRVSSFAVGLVCLGEGGRRIVVCPKIQK
jgi:hypothetical protein